uniref:Uncharacterized protein n=1 Tax=Anguilla anguilla TaxID=7936 RepID=A0A0E9QYW2_ANGAN
MCRCIVDVQVYCRLALSGRSVYSRGVRRLVM